MKKLLSPLGRSIFIVVLTLAGFAGSVVPVDPDSSVSYSGNYHIEVQNHLSENNFLYKFNFTDTALGSDGTREVFRVRNHILINANGVERDIDDVRWICN